MSAVSCIRVTVNLVRDKRNVLGAYVDSVVTTSQALVRDASDSSSAEYFVQNRSFLFNHHMFPPDTAHFETPPSNRSTSPRLCGTSSSNFPAITAGSHSPGRAGKQQESRILERQCYNGQSTAYADLGAGHAAPDD